MNPSVSSDVHATSTVKVSVSGTVDVPLKLSMLEGLQDPALEEEVYKESVRLSVADHLGHFDRIDVTLHSASGQSPPRCEARVRLDELGQCIEAIQAAYEHVMVRAQLLREVLDARKQVVATSSSSSVEADGAPRIADYDDAMRALVEEMLQGPPHVVQAAAASVDHSVAIDTHKEADKTKRNDKTSPQSSSRQIGAADAAGSASATTAQTTIASSFPVDIDDDSAFTTLFVAKENHVDANGAAAAMGDGDGYGVASGEEERDSEREEDEGQEVEEEEDLVYRRDDPEAGERRRPLLRHSSDDKSSSFSSSSSEAREEGKDDEWTEYRAMGYTPL